MTVSDQVQRGSTAIFSRTLLPSGRGAVLAMQVREQEYQWKRERPDKHSNPRPGFETASSTLGNSTGGIDRTDKNDQGDEVHDARSNPDFSRI
jgi:hypothetical protein